MEADSAATRAQSAAEEQPAVAQPSEFAPGLPMAEVERAWGDAARVAPWATRQPTTTHPDPGVPTECAPASGKPAGDYMDSDDVAWLFT